MARDGVMGKVETRCPACSQCYQVAEAQLGKKARCKKCDTTFVIAASDSPPPTRSSEPDVGQEQSAETSAGQSQSPRSISEREAAKPPAEAKGAPTRKARRHFRGALTRAGNLAAKCGNSCWNRSKAGL